jgi:nitric oxide reductase large subunit
MFNIGMTIWQGKRHSTTSLVLFFGLLMAALLYLPGMIDTDNQTLDSYWRWWVVHLWVEGVWELIMGAILSFLLIKLTGIDREIIEKWLYVIVGFTFLSGVLGTGHHYYYIGTPKYWLIVGGVFSALEPVAFLGMAIYAITMARKGGPDASQSERAVLDGGLLGDVLCRGRIPGLCAHAAAGQHVHARHADHRDARPHGVLGGVCDVGARNHCLCDAAFDGTEAA